MLKFKCNKLKNICYSSDYIESYSCINDSARYKKRVSVVDAVKCKCYRKEYMKGRVF